jgi:translocation and assembly module TamB
MNVAGVVDVESFLYERAVKVFDVNALQTAQRTEVEAYDPARDFATFDIELRSKAGFHLRNNLADATVQIGPAGLRAVGSNQRWGMIGEVYVVTGGIFRFRNHDFEIREGALKFTDETKIDPAIDVVATTDYRRAAGAGSSAAAEWRIKLHAYGLASDLKLELTSDPPLSQEDAILLLTIGMTRAEANALGGGGVAGGAGLDFLANLAGVDQTVKQAIPVIDDFRFGTAYSVKTGRTEPQITLGKRLTDSVRASVTSGFGEQREVLSNIEWQLSQKMSLQGSYDNINDITSSSVGNVGVDLRYRLEFE